eukprot:5194001-Alexandrium_andersonii.AAC.1
MTVLSGRGPARSGQGGRVGRRARPDLALRIVASHAGGELELAPVVMARLEAFQLVGAERAVVQIDHLAERGGLSAAQPAGGERQGHLQGRRAPRASLREREGADWLR